MKAIVKQKSAPGLGFEDVPIPEPKEHEVLIKTLKTSICGTDLHIYKWDEWAQKTLKPPLVIGHEFVGEIAALGSHVHGLTVGTRVCGEGHILCGHCNNCRSGKKHLCQNTIGLGVHCHGCFAEYFTLPAENVFPIPDSIPNDIAAIFDPLGNAVHTALSFELAGEDVLITGAGPIGIMATAIARKVGAHHVVITDVNDYRLELATQLGATTAVNVKTETLQQAMSRLGVHWEFTVGLEMSGNPQALASMLENMQNGGRIALLGLLPAGAGINWDLVIFKMLQIKGIYGREIFATWHKMIHLLESGLDLSPLITHRFAAEDYQQGFEVLMSGNSGKVILDWGKKRT